MERVISDEEKIRRAIEISQRRNQNLYTNNTTRVNVNENKKDYKLFKKMVLQMVICLLIYFIFYLISTTNYSFSKEVLKSTNNILNYDINLEKLYQDCKFFIISNFNKNEDNMNESKIVVENNVNNIVEDNVESNNNTNNDVNNSIENIASINNVVTNEIIDSNNEKEERVEKDKDEENSDRENKMEEDAKKVKELCIFQKPLNGTITSEFGEREVIANGMTSDHKGIDIATKSGTNIKAAMSGTVTVAEENKEYGKFVKITNGDVMTVYAHCKTLKVKVGNKIKIGQTIATVGSTGVSTGPHLHFEIRLSGRYINPRYVIDF